MYKRIANPVNKDITQLLKRKPKTVNNIKYINNKSVLKGVSIITCTCKLNSLNTIINNYTRQKYSNKELIVVINNNTIDLNNWTMETEKYETIKIFQIDEAYTLGECLNYAVEQSKYYIVAKFDDDDYYGPEYLLNSIRLFDTTKADVIGKATYFIYFKQSDQLAISRNGKENSYVNFLAGPTLIFNKKVFAKVKFRKLNLGEDKHFLQDCLSVNFKLYSSDRYDFLYYRQESKENHTWKIEDERFIKHCELLCKINDSNNFISIVNKSTSDKKI